MRTRALLLLMALLLTSCSAPKPPAPVVIDALALQLQVPATWEHMDHGRQQLFRLGEQQLSLTQHELERDSLTMSEADADAAMLRIALRPGFNAERYEIAHRKERTLNGIVWTDLETWSRLTHTQRRRVAYARVGEQLLVLDTDRGDAVTLQPVFEALLHSIEPVTPAH